MSTNNLVPLQWCSSDLFRQWHWLFRYRLQTSGVKAVPLAKKAGAPFAEANAPNALSGAYPLSRYLYIYVNKAPNKPLANSRS